MAKGSSGVHYPNPYNETGTGGPETADVTGEGLYFGGWPEINKMHLSTDGADLDRSDNADMTHDLYGGPAKGEANPGGWDGRGGSK